MTSVKWRTAKTRGGCLEPGLLPCYLRDSMSEWRRVRKNNNSRSRQRHKLRLMKAKAERERKNSNSAEQNLAKTVGSVSGNCCEDRPSRSFSRRQTPLVSKMLQIQSRVHALNGPDERLPSKFLSGARARCSSPALWWSPHTQRRQPTLPLEAPVTSAET